MNLLLIRVEGHGSVSLLFDLIVFFFKLRIFVRIFWFNVRRTRAIFVRGIGFV